MRIEVSEFEIESPRVNFRSKMRSDLRRSATEAQLGLESEHELEFALESKLEFAFELPSSNLSSSSSWRWRAGSSSSSF